MPDLTAKTMSNSDVSRPIFARFYARAGTAMERAGMTEHRRRLLAGLSGRVIEIGAGNGLNFPHYPDEVNQVLAVEPNPHLRHLAEREAERAPVAVEMSGGVAEHLPAHDGVFDAAVVTLVLCSVPDQGRALAEIRRVLRPGGRLLFLEHVRASTPALRRVQRLVDATVGPFLIGGCHTGRDTAAAIEAAGFAIERMERFRFPEMRVALPHSPHIVGAAALPAARQAG